MNENLIQHMLEIVDVPCNTIHEYIVNIAQSRWLVSELLAIIEYNIQDDFERNLNTSFPLHSHPETFRNSIRTLHIIAHNISHNPAIALALNANQNEIRDVLIHIIKTRSEQMLNQLSILLDTAKEVGGVILDTAVAPVYIVAGTVYEAAGLFYRPREVVRDLSNMGGAAIGGLTNTICHPLETGRYLWNRPARTITSAVAALAPSYLGFFGVAQRTHFHQSVGVLSSNYIETITRITVRTTLEHILHGGVTVAGAEIAEHCVVHAAIHEAVHAGGDHDQAAGQQDHNGPVAPG